MAELKTRLADIRELGATDPVTALGSARNLLRRHPKDPDVLGLLAECCLAAGNDAGARRYAKRALAVRPGNGPANLVFGKLLIKRNRLRKALPYLRKALRSPQSRVKAHGEVSKPLFEIAERTSEYTEARNHLRLYLRHHPENTDAWMDLAWECYYCGRWEECDEICERAKAIDPKSARPYIMQGLSRNMQGNYADAMACYRQAIETDPASARAYERMGGLKHVLNDYVGAVECVLYSLQLNAESPRNWTSLLYVLDSATHRMLFPRSDSMDMPELMKQICEAALKHARDDSADSVMLRYRIHQRLGNEEASLAEGRRYVKLFPETKVSRMMRNIVKSRRKCEKETETEDDDEERQEFLCAVGYLLPSAPIESEEAREMERLWELFQRGDLPRPQL